MKRIEVGSRVLHRFGLYDVSGHVIEDRGNLGVGGRRLLRIRFLLGETAVESEVPEEDLRPL